jgi:hypothetical protein
VSVRRSPGGAPWRRYLVASGVALSLVLVPGLAQAGDEPLPQDPAAALLGGDDTGTGDTGTQEGAVTPPAPPTLPPELQAALEAAVSQLTDALGVPEDCATGIQTAIELIIAGLTEPPPGLEPVLTDIQSLLEALATGTPPDPTALQGLADDIQDLLTGGTTTTTTTTTAASSTTPAEDPALVQGLKLLAKTLQEDCQPTQAASSTSRPATSSSSGVAAATTSAAPTSPSTQAVVYLGYAPTGGEVVDEASATGPLATLGGAVLLLGAATAVGYRRRARAAGSRE